MAGTEIDFRPVRSDDFASRRCRRCRDRNTLDAICVIFANPYPPPLHPPPRSRTLAFLSRGDRWCEFSARRNSISRRRETHLWPANLISPAFGTYAIKVPSLDYSLLGFVYICVCTYMYAYMTFRSLSDCLLYASHILSVGYMYYKLIMTFYLRRCSLIASYIASRYYVYNYREIFAVWFCWWNFTIWCIGDVNEIECKNMHQYIFWMSYRSVKHMRNHENISDRFRVHINLNLEVDFAWF